MLLRYYIGEPVFETFESDVLFLSVRDSASAISAKTAAFFRFALEHLEFDFLFKCEDDTYLAADRLMALIVQRSSTHFLGSKRSQGEAEISAGAGFLLSRSAVEQLIKTPPSSRGSDATWVHQTLARAGISPERDPDLLPDSSNFPSPANRVISCHWCTAQLMRGIYRSFPNALGEQPFKQYEAFHSDWKGNVSLFSDGVFVGGPLCGNGLWSYSVPKAMLTLEFFYWPAQHLVRTPAGFANNAISLNDVTPEK